MTATVRPVGGPTMTAASKERGTTIIVEGVAAVVKIISEVVEKTTASQKDTTTKRTNNIVTKNIAIVAAIVRSTKMATKTNNRNEVRNESINPRSRTTVAISSTKNGNITRKRKQQNPLQQTKAEKVETNRKIAVAAAINTLQKTTSSSKNHSRTRPTKNTNRKWKVPPRNLK